MQLCRFDTNSLDTAQFVKELALSTLRPVDHHYKSRGLEMTSMKNELADQVSNIRKPWEGSIYYSNAEKWTFLFWDEGMPIRKFFNRLDLKFTVELACGHGRHAERSAPLAKKLLLVDVIEENLNVCRERLSQFAHVNCALGTGTTFPAVKPNSVTAIYCYDAMVHFSPDIIESYLKDTCRVLKKGGRALYHHSNYADGEGKHWATNPHARNFMTLGLFSELASKHGLKVVEQAEMDWAGVKSLDGLTLLEKP